MLKLNHRHSDRTPQHAGFPQEPKTLPLFELSLNAHNLSSSSNHKHTIKPLNMKFHKAQMDHCCIDIVNRKPGATSRQEKQNANQSFKASNIALLKKEIEYLERDRLKWQKFPNEEILMMTAQPKSTSAEQQPAHLDIKVHSLEQVMADGNRSMLLEGLFSTFDRSFYIAPLKERPLTSDQKRFRGFLSTSKKKSLKKCGAIDPATLSVSDKESLRKTIHNKTDLSSPFRRYFIASRSRRNSSCGAQVVGQKMKKFSHLGQQGVTTL